MSLRKSLKTYLIVAVMLVMGGMAVKTVGIADESGDSYTLTIEKVVKGIQEEEIYKDKEYTFEYEIEGGEKGEVTVKAGGDPTKIPVEGACTVTIREKITDEIDRLGDYKLETDNIKYEPEGNTADNTADNTEVTLSVKGKVDGTSAKNQGIYVEDNGKITIGLGEQAESGKPYLYRILDAEGNLIGDEVELSVGGEAPIDGLAAGRYYVEMAEKPETSGQPSLASDLPAAGGEEGAGMTSVNIVSPKGPDAIGAGKTDGEESEKEGDTEKKEEEKSETQTDSDKEDDASKAPGEVILDEDVARASLDDVKDDTSNSDNASDPDGDDADENGSEGTDTDEADITGNEEDNLLEPDINVNNESNENDLDENTPNINEPESETESGIMPMSSEEEELEYTYTDFEVSYEYDKTGNLFENIDYLEGVEVTVETGDLPVGNYQVKISGGDINASVPFVKNEDNEDTTSRSFSAFVGYTNENPLPEGTYRMEITDGSESPVSGNGREVTVTLGNTKHINLICTNPYKRLEIGAYNIVHEYYVDRITSRGAKECEGISSITIKEDILGTSVYGEDVPKVLEFGGHKYKYVKEENAYGFGKEDSTVSGNEAGIAPASEDGDQGIAGDNEQNSGGWEPVKDYVEDDGKTYAEAQKAGNEVVILKYVRTTEPDDPKDPEDPKDPPKDPETPPDLPDPNDPDSPPTITITDDDVPRTYVRVWDSEKEEWVYLPEDEVPLAGRTSAKTADGMAPVFWMFVAGLSVAGVGAFRYNKKRKEE